MVIGLRRADQGRLDARIGVEPRRDALADAGAVAGRTAGGDVFLVPSMAVFFAASAEKGKGPGTNSRAPTLT